MGLRPICAEVRRPFSVLAFDWQSSGFAGGNDGKKGKNRRSILPAGLDVNLQRTSLSPGCQSNPCFPQVCGGKHTTVTYEGAATFSRSETAPFL
jgi:hypothetical protein